MVTATCRYTAQSVQFSNVLHLSMDRKMGYLNCFVGVFQLNQLCFWTKWFLSICQFFRSCGTSFFFFSYDNSSWRPAFLWARSCGFPVGNLACRLLVLSCCSSRVEAVELTRCYEAPSSVLTSQNHQLDTLNIQSQSVNLRAYSLIQAYTLNGFIILTVTEPRNWLLHHCVCIYHHVYMVMSS